MSEFEWDEDKNTSNQEKHKIAFEDATDVFNDEERLQYASDKNGETRFLTIGKAFQAIVSVVYYYKRTSNQNNISLTIK